jgi:Raf kinase inhibitor-like YbhB/YbcL family protein
MWFLACGNGRSMTISGLSLARIAFVFLLPAGLMACRQASVNDRVPMSLTLSSPDFRQGQTIPDQFTCSGANTSPALSWGTLPSNTKSLVLLVTDPDSLSGAYVHWVLYNLPPDPNHVDAAMPHSEVLPGGAKQGLNTDDAIGYTGPCPPGKSTHRYVFTLYALDAMLSPESPVNKKQLLQAMKGHVLATGQLTGRYQR